MDLRGITATLFGVPRALVGMVHVQALPGTAAHGLSLDAIVEAAVADARRYREAGFDGVMVENMHDRPYLRGGVGPEVVACLTRVAREVRGVVGLPLGVQVLAAANREALAVAQAAGASFVRVEGFVFGHVADEGFIESDAGALLRYRRAIGADSVRVFADVKKKHSAHAITADVDLAETARAAEFFLADGVVVTGASTGRPASPDEVRAVAEAVGVPTCVGSGLTPENLDRFGAAEVLIVGSSAKEDGRWERPVDPARAAALALAHRASKRT